MNQELIDMARQAGVRDDEHRFEFNEYKYLETFAALVAAAERKVWADEFAGMGEWTCVNIIEGKTRRNKMNLTNYQDDFIRVRNRPDQAKPEVQHRELERVKVGTWFFGLLPVYKYHYTEWKTQK